MANKVYSYMYITLHVICTVEEGEEEMVHRPVDMKLRLVDDVL